MPDNFKTETIYLSKYIKPKPIEEIFAPMKRKEFLPENIAMFMGLYMMNDIVINP